MVQRHGLLGQLLVGLLQLGLLVFQRRLRLRQDVRLLLQFFVGRAQFFLLDLQLFIELLGFAQRILKALAVHRAMHRSADGVGNQPGQFHVARLQPPEKGHLDHARHLRIVVQRHHQHMARRGLPEARSHLEVVGRHVVQPDDAVFQCRPSHQALGTVEGLLDLFAARGKAMGGHAPEQVIAVATVKRRHRGIEVVRQEFQRAVPQPGHVRLAEHLFGQPRLAAAQPGLLLEQGGMVGLLLEHLVVIDRQAQQFAPSPKRQQAADAQREQQIGQHAPERGAARLFIALHQQPLFHCDEAREFQADLVLQALSPACAGQRNIVQVLAAHGNGLFCIVVPLFLQADDLLETGHLNRVVANQSGQGNDFAVKS